MKQVKQAWDWLVWIISVGAGIQGPSSLVPGGPGVIRAGGYV